MPLKRGISFFVLCVIPIPHTRDHTPQEYLCHFDRRGEVLLLKIIRFLACARNGNDILLSKQSSGRYSGECRYQYSV